MHGRVAAMVDLKYDLMAQSPFAYFRGAAMVMAADLATLSCAGVISQICGELLARGHARSGDPLMITGYLGSGGGFAEALARFGKHYADQTEKDWEQIKPSRR